MAEEIIKKDIYNNREHWQKWKEANSKRIENLSPSNSKLLLEFLNDMENGINTPPRAKGKREPTTLLNLKDHVSFFMKHIDKPFLKLTKEEIHEFENKVSEGKIKKRNGKKFSAFGNYIKDLKSFWGWVVRTERAKEDITRDLSKRNEKKPAWVYLTEEQFKDMANSAIPDYRTLIWFMLDAGCRVTEAYSLKVKNFDKDFTELTIPSEVAKTFGRVIKLKICQPLIKEYIRLNKLNPEDYFIIKKAAAFNKYLREHCTKLFGDGETKARGRYSEFSIYSIRHNSACYWLKRYPDMKGLKYRMGWTREEQATYYHEFLGMSDQISDENMLTNEEKTKLEQEIIRMKKQLEDEKEIKDQEIESIKEESKKNKEVFDEKMKELEKMDMYFARSMENPKIVVRLKKLIEDRIKQEMIEARKSKRGAIGK